MHVLSVNLSAEPRAHPNDPGRVTGVYKEPADELFAGPLGVLGDHVCDRKYHGDPAKALCIYCGQHYEHWRDTYPQVPWGPGCFGENLTVLGVTEETVHLGDTWEAGEALLQVSQPRQPCGTLSGRHGVPDLVKAAVG
ncbi:MAG: MOSC domain-containing protein, partial [Armatimonadetes bacterium]|nr:MOSC domain-containing protein [Armatimonadota bacterium]